MLKRGKLIHEDQRGISLIEMVTVVALIGLLAAAIVMTLAQVLTVSRSATDRMIAVRQVQQAGKEVSKDVLQSNTVTFNEGGDFRLNVYWLDHQDVSHNVTYEISAGNLERTHTAGEGSASTRVVAQYISSSGTNCTREGDKIIFRVTAEVGDDVETRTVETRTYEIQPRPTPTG